MNAFVIDAFEFSRHREQREGDVAITDLPRLAAESVNMPASLHWSLHGGTDGLGHPQLIMSVSGSIHLMCQRCMTPLKFDIASESVLVLAKNDEHADEIDALLADDTIDVIVGSKALNVSDLIEDEALLSLPQAPKHDVCPDNAAVDSVMNSKNHRPSMC